MALTRIVLAWAAVTLLFVIWGDLTRRIRRVPGTTLAALRADFTPNAIEALLLTLFAGLWFGSLGSGGAWLLFLVVGGLMEIPSRLRSHPVEGLPWFQVALGIARVMAAGVALSFLLV